MSPCRLYIIIIEYGKGTEGLYEDVIAALKELVGWLEVSPGSRTQVEAGIEHLKRPGLTDFQRRQVRRTLSGEILFHPKWLGNLYLPDFPADGTRRPWHSYPARVRDLCQRALAE